jgi:hypothetical protein
LIAQLLLLLLLLLLLPSLAARLPDRCLGSSSSSQCFCMRSCCASFRCICCHSCGAADLAARPCCRWQQGSRHCTSCTSTVLLVLLVLLLLPGTQQLHAWWLLCSSMCLLDCLQLSIQLLP